MRSWQPEDRRTLAIGSTISSRTGLPEQHRPLDRGSSRAFLVTRMRNV
jgi:hypothetical protein